ncbi:MAG: FecR domain-containing protein [Bacteroidetes bacterium]|nr:FecR domain-containing protein [Bacteroidota bacterium]
MNHFDKYSELIAKHLAGQTTPTEDQDLLDWADADAENQAFFDEMAQTWALTDGAALPPFDADLAQAWGKIDAGTSTRQPPLERSTTKVVHLSKIVRRWSVAAAILLTVGTAFWWFSKQPGQVQLVEIQTFDNEKKAITLPDSSQVWLNENSKLAYDTRFEQRHVALDGEAFFEVERLVQRPFEIVSGDATTTVLGTSFNVRAYAAEDKIEVTVKTGKVALTATKSKGLPVYITPGESGIFDKKAEKVTVATEEFENADAWKTLHLEFDNEKMAYVISTLERYFGVNIVVSDPSLLECPYTAPFDQPDLDAILTVIGSTIGFEFTHEGNDYLLTGKGCDGFQ